jgi:FKBP-type peptidyl-prolyl cis-trans isomerase
MMRITFRPAFLALTALAVAIVSSACVDSTGVGCDAVSNVQTSVHLDSVITNSGLIYRELTVGTGATIQSIDECQDVRLRYIGRLANGTEFDRTPTGQTTSVTVGEHGVIPGFEQGLVGMKVGGTRQLIIPPHLAYGSQTVTDGSGHVIIPANSTIVFDVELVAID